MNFKFSCNESEHEQLIEFRRTLKLIIERISNKNVPKLFGCAQRTKMLYEQNVASGKQIRGLIVVKTFGMLAKKSNKVLTRSEKQDSYILAWIIEMLQSAALIFDDIVDESLMRRGQPCWYKQVGMSAINDGLLLQEHSYLTLKTFLSDRPYYLKTMEILHQFILMTLHGQIIDMNSQVSMNKLENFNESRLETIYKFKTSYYSFVLPVKLGMIASSCDSEKDLEESESVLLKIGHLFQMQDDFLDCFGDPTVTGKVGTDIADGKCCWPIVTALQMCDKKQLEVLNINYGIKCEVNVNAVKQIYEELDLINVFQLKVSLIYDNLMTEIANLKKGNNLCTEIFEFILAKIQRRNK